MALRLPRRTFLRGAGGALLALPALEAMLNPHGEAYAGGGGAIPLRYLLCFGGFSLGADSDPIPNNFVPVQTGPNYELTTALATLANHGNVRDEISIVSGLRIPSQAAVDPSEPIPPGGRTASFHWHQNPVLSGNRSVDWDLNDTGDSEVTGPTSDQVVAEALGGKTTFRSLAYRAQALFYNSQIFPDRRDLMSYRLDAQSQVVPVFPVFSPRQAYDSLFTGFVPTDPVEAAAKALELDKRRSILDRVDRRMSGLLDRVSAADKIRLERHYEEIRELERLLDAVPPDTTGQCSQLPDPGDDPPLGGDIANGADWAVNLGYSEEDLRLRLFADLVHMAVVCDLTRVASLMFTMFQSFLNVHPFTGHEWNQHELNHSAGTAPLNDVIAWHMDHFGYLVSRLRDTPEGAGTVLDSCATVFMIEGGYGQSFENGAAWSSHSTENMAWLVAGGAGGLRRGEHIVAPAGQNHPANVLISAMHAVGVEQDLGQVSGYIPELFT